MKSSSNNSMRSNTMSTMMMSSTMTMMDQRILQLVSGSRMIMGNGGHDAGEYYYSYIDSTTAAVMMEWSGNGMGNNRSAHDAGGWCWILMLQELQLPELHSYHCHLFIDEY